MDFAIQLTSTTITAWQKGVGIVLSEPVTYAYTRDRRGRIFIEATGQPAVTLSEKPPLSGMQFAKFTVPQGATGKTDEDRLAEHNANELPRAYIREIIKKLGIGRKPSIAYIIPASFPSRDLHSLRRLTVAAGAYHVEFILAPLTTAFAYGYRAGGCLSIHIGHDATDVAIFEGGKIIAGGTIATGGRAILDGIVDHFRGYAIKIAHAQALQLYHEVGTLFDGDTAISEVTGIDIGMHRPREVIFTGADAAKIMYPLYEKIARTVNQILPKVSLDVQAQIKGGAIYIGGAFSGATGLTELLTDKLDISVSIDPKSTLAQFSGAFINHASR